MITSITSQRNEIARRDVGTSFRYALATVVFAMAVLSSTQARAEAPTICDGTMSSGTFEAVIVPSSTACVIENFTGVTVVGNVLVQSGSSLSVVAHGALFVGGNVSLASGASLIAHSGLVVEGSLVAQQPTKIELIDFFVGKDIKINGGGEQGIVLNDGLVGNNVSIVGANAPTAVVTVLQSHIEGQLSIINSSAVTVESNTIDSNLICIGKTNVTFSGNTIGGQVVGQCG